MHQSYECPRRKWRSQQETARFYILDAKYSTSITEVIDMTIVLIHVMTVDKYIGTELFSDIRDARKFKEEMRHKYGEKYKFREMVRNLNDDYDDHILNRY